MNAQAVLPGLEPMPGFRRVECGCGCGVWFYHPRKPGRTRLYANATHYRRAKARRTDEREINAASHRRAYWRKKGLQDSQGSA